MAEISRLKLKTYDETLEALALLIAEYDTDDVPDRSIPFRNKVYAINVLLGGYKGKIEMELADRIEKLEKEVFKEDEAKRKSRQIGK